MRKRDRREKKRLRRLWYQMWRRIDRCNDFLRCYAIEMVPNGVSTLPDGRQRRWDQLANWGAQGRRDKRNGDHKLRFYEGNET